MKSPSKLISEWNIDPSWTLFLDRDGVINQKIEGYVSKWEEFQFVTGVPEAIAGLNHIFHKIFIVTNQQGIDKELMTHEDLGLVHEKMLEVLDFYGAHVDEIYYEPSLAAFDSHRRKPNPGMAIQAKEEFPSIDFSKSVIVGDSWSDIQMGNRVGMKTVWVENNHDPLNVDKIKEECDFSIGGLADFYGLISK